MGIFDKKTRIDKQAFTVPVAIKAETEQQAAEAARTLALIASFFNAGELAKVAKALNNPAVRAIIRSKL